MGPESDDAALARRCREGDVDAWTLLVDRHRPALVQLARRFLARADAEDVVDGVIADIWERRKLERFEGRSTLATWLGAVVIHAALNARRNASVRARVVADAERADPAAEPDSVADRATLAQLLTDAIAALPSESKTLVLLYYEQDLTLDQAALVLARSKSTLSRTLRDARQAIRAYAESAARERFGTTLDALRAGADLSELDVDLRAACARRRDGLGRSVSKP